MIRSLLGFSLNQRLATIAIVICIVLAGIYSWIELTKTAYPDVGDTEVEVITTYPGQAAQDVEQQVTLPLERALNGIPGVIDERSKTIFGLSDIMLTFKDGTDDYFARQQVTEKLNDANLPPGVNPSLGPLVGPVDEILRYVIEANDNYTPMQLRTLQDWVIIPRIRHVPGVADVVNFGGLVKQYQVITSPEKLFHYNLTIRDLINAIQENNVNTGGNIIPRGEQGFVVRGIGAIRSKEDIENIVVKSENGAPVFIKDVASVEEQPSPPTGILGYTLQPNDSTKIDVNSSIQGLVDERRGENPSEVIKGIVNVINNLNENVLPDGVHLKITYNRTQLVNYTIDTVSRTLLEGFTIVILVLIFFVGSVRSALVVVTVIPVSLLFAFILMKLTGIPANLLSLGAIDFGIIVDGAVVMVENIMRRYRDATQEEKRQGILKLTLTAAQEVGREIFFSITIIILAYLPIFSFQRVEGKLFSPMAYTLSFAILGSLLLALTFIPVLMSIIYKKYFETGDTNKIEWHNPVYYWLEERYGRIISFLTKYNIQVTIGSIIIVLIVVLIGVKNVGTEFLPELDEGAFNLRCFFPVGITLQDANKYCSVIRNVISSHKQVNVILTQLGRNDDGTDPYGPDRLEILVGLRDYSTWIKDTTKEQLLSVMKRQLEDAIPSAEFSFSQPILDNVTEEVTGSVADLAILINGQNLDFMRREADSILAIIRKIPGASESGIEQEGDQAQLSVNVNRESAARFGINVSNIQEMIEAAIGGKPIGALYDSTGRKFDIVVRYSSKYRGSIQAVENMLVASPSGGRIPMSQLASISLVDGPTIIQREGGERQISVRTNIRGRDQGGFVAEAQKKIDASIHLPKDYSIEWGGQFENLARAGKRLEVVIPITLIIVFLILFSMYKNIKHIGIAMSSIPFAIIGGILALLIRGYNFNVSAGVGFISLFGVSIIAGVLYVSRANRLVEDSGMKIKEAAKKAAIIQLRPNLMTMLLALLGLMPAARATGIGSDIQRPLATVIVGGLCTALILTLLTLPSLYILFEGKGNTGSTDKEGKK